MSNNPYESPSATAKPDPPVKVKAYGIIPLTKKGYLWLQVFMGVMFVALALYFRPAFARAANPIAFIDDYFISFVACILGLEGVETLVMLGKFKKAQQAVATKGNG